MALPRTQRLKKSKDFEAAFRFGRTANGDFLFVKFKRSESGIRRFGFIISAKVSPLATVRNKIRRILSEAVRKQPLSARDAYDTVVVITKNPGDVSLLRKDLLAVLRAHKIL